MDIFKDALRGEKVYKAVSGRIVITGKAKNQSNILAPFCYTGTCNTQLFNVWLEKFWAFVKKRVEEVLYLYSSLAEAIDQSFLQVWS